MKLKPFSDELPIPQYAVPKEKHKCFTYYEIGMKEFYHQFHKDLKPTKVWGYNGQLPGPLVNVERGECTHIKWSSQLPHKHFLPIDRTLHASGEHMPEVRTVVHLHGAEVEPESDGYPDAWFTNGYKYVGPVFDSPVYKYNNDQRAAALWYHDHAIGITRLNVYAGLAGMYIIRDEEERKLNLPSGAYEIPLIITDRSFNEDGSLFYPTVPQAVLRDPDPGLELPNPSVVPGAAFDTITVNGKVWPYLNVEPRKYRFRILNASNERFYTMRLSSGTPFVQIGSDGGLLEKSVWMEELTIGPAERKDVILDFSKHKPGDEITITNTAVTPLGLPAGAGGRAPDPETTGKVMQFRVVELTAPDTSDLSDVLSWIPKLNECDANRTRDVVIGAEADRYGRFHFLLDDKGFMERIDVKPKLNDTEIWQFVNPAGVVHPMHIHLIQFQLLDRIQFDAQGYAANGLIEYTAAPEPPAENETGWKDTIQCPPGYVTRVIMRFAPFTGRYVYHCHILEHEDYDMMRPFEVVRELCDCKGDCSCSQDCTHYKLDDCGYGCGKKQIAGRKKQKEKPKKKPHHPKPCHEQKKKCPKCSKTYRYECE